MDNVIINKFLLRSVMLSSCAIAIAQERPNILFILADDIGYGDLGCYGATDISTPNIDALARVGTRFTAAHSAASTSSPTRYALLTGEYAWRKRVGILPADAHLTIDTTKNNIAKQLKSVGYKTALIGKWHLGLGDKNKTVDFNNKIEMGPKEVGFDYSYYFPATNDRVPTLFIENQNVSLLDPSDPITISYRAKVGNDPTGSENPEMLKLKHFQGHDGTIVNGIGRIGWMSGGESARWVDENISDSLLTKVTNYIDGANAEEPFFIFYAPHNAHEPRVPAPQFKGKSRAGIYGDVIEEFDYQVGKIVTQLKKKGIYDNTIIIITSDNGPMIKEGYIDGALENIGSHDPYGGLRGEKYSLYEGGTRVPFIVIWGSKTQKGLLQHQTFCYLDMLATVTSIVGAKPLYGSLNDSKDASQLFTNPTAPTYRKFVITQNNNGVLSLRKGDFKFISASGNNEVELYNLKDDIAEKNNLVNNPQFKSIIREFSKEIARLKNKS